MDAPTLRIRWQKDYPIEQITVFVNDSPNIISFDRWIDTNKMFAISEPLSCPRGSRLRVAQNIESILTIVPETANGESIVHLNEEGFNFDLGLSKGWIRKAQI